MRLKRIKIQMSLLTSLQAIQALRRNVDVVYLFMTLLILCHYVCEMFHLRDQFFQFFMMSDD